MEAGFSAVSDLINDFDEEPANRYGTERYHNEMTRSYQKRYNIAMQVRKEREKDRRTKEISKNQMKDKDWQDNTWDHLNIENRAKGVRL